MMTDDEKSCDFHAIEKKWQKYWLKNSTFKADNGSNKPKFYVLDMFPYPSGSGLHVGHPEGYTATDVVARYKWMNGFNVLHPMGWDSFGLPAEQHALETGVHPETTTKKNIEVFKRQIMSLGLAYDWDRELATSNPEYYRWTQWIFLKLYENDLAYQADTTVNYCPELGTVLADEEVIDGKSERGGFPVERRPMRQWMLRITDYADRLLEDLDLLDWPENIKEMQRNWIGKSKGADVDFEIRGEDEPLTVYTTRPDTLFGATFLVLAPEHPMVERVTTKKQQKDVKAYVKTAGARSDMERTDESRDKTGVFTGAYAVNPVNDKRIPIWVADYVLITYGTGAIMAVPAHDVRDFEFARKFDIPIIEVVSPDGKPSGELEAAFVGEGIAINSGTYDGMKSAEFKKAVTRDLGEKGRGKAAIRYKLRDWVFSRQRYWGEPFPLVHKPDGAIAPLDESELPLVLPDVESYEPSGDGESPLGTIEDWVKYRDGDGKVVGRRETHTMPQWAGSCWYFLRYIDPGNDRAPVDPDKEQKWMPVDLYVGGAEHAVLHLMYARFWHKFLYDIGVVSTPEPFMKLVNQGLILGEDGQKMSKSRGNVVNPDDIVSKHGADALRIYELFMGPIEAVKPWNTSGIQGARRFLDRVWRLYQQDIDDSPVPRDLRRTLHKTISKVTGDIKRMRFNTAIAQMMILVSEALKEERRYKEVQEKFVLILAPFAPHLCEELYERLGHSRSISKADWPAWDAKLVVDQDVKLAIQVNGRLRGDITVRTNTPDAEVKAQALTHENVRRYVEGKDIKKAIVVKNRLVNFVV